MHGKAFLIASCGRITSLAYRGRAEERKAREKFCFRCCRVSWSIAWGRNRSRCCGSITAR